MLAEMLEVEELNPVPDAHVPVMNFKFDGVSIDLLYARLDLWVVPEVSISYSVKKTLGFTWFDWDLLLQCVLSCFESLDLSFC